MSTSQTPLTRRSKFKQAVTATGAALAIITLSACGGASESAVAPEPSVSASVAPAETAAPIPAEVNGIPVKGVAQNVNGKYLQTTLSADDPILDFDQNFIYGDNIAAFTEEEIREAVRVASVFTAEEGIDSILNGSNDPADVDAWWAANQHKFKPEKHAEVYEYAKAGNWHIIRTADGQPGSTVKHWQDENSTRVHSRNNHIIGVEIDSHSVNAIGVYTAIDYQTWEIDKAGQKSPINVTGTLIVFLSNKNPSGEWLIEGLHTQMHQK